MTACHERGETRVRWTPRPDGMEESVQFVPGYNCPVPVGSGHGVHGMEIRWHLRGPAGAVVLVMFTDFIPGERWPGHGLSPSGRHETWNLYPAGGGVHYHGRAPLYDGHEADDGCPLLGGQCYRDIHYMGADDAVKRFPAEGEQVIWDALEEAYKRLGGQS